MKNKQAAGETLEFGSAPALGRTGGQPFMPPRETRPSCNYFLAPQILAAGDALKTNSRRSLVLAQFLPRTFRTINHGEINEPQV